jgi:hypothetical protein
MSYDFEHEKRVLWSPSRSVAQLFLCQVRHLEGVLGLSASMNEYMSDTIDLDFSQLDLFLQELSEWANFENTSLKLLLRGTAVHLLALGLCRDSSDPGVNSRYPNDWVEEARLVASGAMKKASPGP